MTINIEDAIAWMREREGQVYYSMEDRDGPDSYDCSSSVYYALRSAGASSAGWAVNTEYEHDWLVRMERSAWGYLHLWKTWIFSWCRWSYWYVR